MTDTGGLLNDRAWRLSQTIRDRIGDLGGESHTLDNGGIVLDLGVNVTGGLEAGLDLSRLCLADRGRVTVTGGSQPTGDLSLIHI